MNDSDATCTASPSERECQPNPSFRSAHQDCGPIIGQCPAVKSLYRLIEKVADSDSTILISGETGTGKGVVARAIHQRSYRHDRPFVSINCGAIPEHLLESELFGHVRGAFTGACAAKPGKFEMANGGTIFLDEIGDMSPHLQVKLLKVLEEGEFEQVGGTRSLQVNVRIIAATHRDLEREVARGRFREDLYYRLYVIPVRLPPLRDRAGDVPVLANHFLASSNQRNRRQVTEISNDTMKLLTRYTWPGNVRELKNVIERLVVLKADGPIEVKDLPPKIKDQSQPAKSLSLNFSDEGISLNSAITEYEKALIIQTLEKTKWVKKQAAQLLQLNRTTLVEKIKRHQIQPCAA